MTVEALKTSQRVAEKGRSTMNGLPMKKLMLGLLVAGVVFLAVDTSDAGSRFTVTMHSSRATASPSRHVRSRVGSHRTSRRYPVQVYRPGLQHRRPAIVTVRLPNGATLAGTSRQIREISERLRRSHHGYRRTRYARGRSGLSFSWRR